MKLKLLLFAFFISSSVFSQFELNWARHTGSSASNYSFTSSDMIEYDNFIYGTGAYLGTFTFGDTASNVSLQSWGISPYIVKHDTAGKLIWAKEFKTDATYSFSSTKIAAKNGYLYVTGCLKDSTDFDPGPGEYKLYNPNPQVNLQNNLDVFVCKLDTAGNLIWAKSFGGADRIEPQSIAIGLNDEVIIGGFFTDTVDFDPGAGTALLALPPFMQQPYITILDASGNFVKVIHLNTGGRVMSLAVAPNGAILATGLYAGLGDFDPGPGQLIFSSQVGDALNAFVWALDPALDLLWAKNLDATMNVEPRYIVSDSAGNIYVCGAYNGTLDMDPGSSTSNQTSSGLSDGYVIRLDSLGNYVWGKSIGGTVYDYIMKVIPTNYGTINISGVFQATCDFDPGPGMYNLSTTSNMAGNYDIYLCSYTTEGHFISAGTVGSLGSDMVTGLCMDQSNRLYITGAVLSEADFDMGAGISLLGSSSAESYFLAKYAPGVCPTFAAVVEFVTDISCSASGFAAAHAINGSGNYTYDWENVADSSNTSATFIYPGIYQLTISDTTGCTSIRQILVNGPDTSMINAIELQVNAFAGPFQTGFPAFVSVSAWNNGCLPASGSLQIVTNPLLLIDSIVPPPDAVSGDTLTWNLNNLIYGSTVQAYIAAHISVSAGIGDTICIQAWVTPAADTYPDNNSIGFCVPVINAYDPNIKSVIPQGECAEHYTLKNETLNYTVQFQNTGNTAATHIYILDTLDASLDLSTLGILEKSHDMVTEILPGNVMKFRFDNIMLPDSTSNEAASHGHVTYEVKAYAGVSEGTVVENTSYIYFDFNEPVVTNTTYNKLVSSIPACSAVGLNKPAQSNEISLYPNPCRNELNIRFSNSAERTLSVLSLQGQEMLAVKCTGLSCELDLGSLAPGFYMIKITEGKKHSLHKLIKAE
ncbi:MAG: hypothetical protein K0S33_2833 [Bacteroidetes bacterium]|jgi:hypothetical protein|nr:hypothetical protein [Bacteroidota bacterium]